jgi:hypothetical protein
VNDPRDGAQRTEASAGAADGSPLRIVDSLVEAAGGEVTLVVHFGSTRSQASPGAGSAHDLFAVVGDYRRFYERVRPGLSLRHGPAFLTALNRWLPPNILHLADADGPGAKLFVISERDLESAMSDHPPDHFCRSRLMQDTVIAFARDDLAAGRLRAQAQRAREHVVRWMAPHLDEPFSVEAFCREMMRVSYAGEIRPEKAGRAREVFESQRDFLVRAFGPILDASEALEPIGDAYAYRRRASWTERLRWRIYFARSKARATLRWTKYTFTFDRWLDYIVAKVQRRTGTSIQLTERQRRWPWLFLWPTFFRVLRSRSTSSE